MGMLIHTPRKSVISLCKCGRQTSGREEPESYVGQVEENEDLEEPTPTESGIFGMHTPRLQNEREDRRRESTMKILTLGKHGKTIGWAGSDPCAALFRGPTTWKDMQRHAPKDTANSQTKVSISIIQSLHSLYRSPSIVKARNLRQLDNWQKYARILR